MPGKNVRSVLADIARGLTSQMGAQAVRTPRRFGLALLFVLAIAAAPRIVEATCTGSTLSALAANMAVNEWCQLATVNNTGLRDVMNDVGEGGYISEFSNSTAWDPVNGLLHYAGAHHGTTYVGRHVIYTAATNAWTLGPWPGGCSSGTASSPCFNHAYDHNTVDPTTGDMYWRHYQDGTTVRRGTNAGLSWSTLPQVPAMQGQCCLTMKYFPELGGLIWVEPDWGVWKWTKATNSWSLIANTSQNVGASVTLWSSVVSSSNITGAYSPTKKVLVVSSGSGGIVWKLDQNGAWTRMPNAPQGIGINTASFVADPASGDFILMTNGSSTVWRLNPTGSGSWSAVSTTMPSALFGMNGPGDGLTGAADTSHGVIIYVKYTGSATQMWLFKLSPTMPSQVVPKPPTGVNAG